MDYHNSFINYNSQNACWDFPEVLIRDSQEDCVQKSMDGSECTEEIRLNWKLVY